MLPANWAVYKINGPLFFAAADRIFAELAQLSAEKQGIVLYLDAVPVLDAGGLAALEQLIQNCARKHTQILLADIQFQPLRTLARAGVRPIKGVSSFYPTLDEALTFLKQNNHF